MAFRICLIGATYSGNKGAAGMLTAAVQSLREKLPENTEYKVFSLYPRRDFPVKQPGVCIVPLKLAALVFVLPFASFLFALFGWIPFSRRLLYRYVPLKELVSADVLLDLSGISFVDGRTATLLYNVCCILPALLVGTPVVKMSQALGPFKSQINRNLAKFLLKRVKFIYSRGSSTSGHLQALGITNWKPSADLAFLLRETGVDAENILPPEIDKRLIIGISPSQVLDSYCSRAGIAYIEILASVLNTIASEQNAFVLIIAHSNLGEKTVSRNNDYHVCSRLYELCDKQRTRLILEDSTPGELRSLAGLCDVYIASRFHSMISALSTATPVLVTSWSHKYMEVMEEFECGKWVLEKNAISAESLELMLNELIACKNDTSERIEANRLRVIKSAWVQIDEVVEMLIMGKNQ